MAPLAVLIISVAACSGGSDIRPPASGPAGFQKVTPSNRLYGPGDLNSAGLKVVKQYEVSGLPHATAAILGFLDRKEYEARFYQTHSDAVLHGSAAAAAVTGEKAVVIGNDIPWAEGAIDRRKCVGAINANCVAKYGDFVIFGNMALLCEGRDSATALEACQAVLAALPPP